MLFSSSILHTLLSELYDECRKKFASKEYTDILNEQQAVVNENSKIQEECFADAIAYAMVFSDMELNYPDDLEQKLLAGKALLLQMMNLQLLAMQNMTVSEESFEIAVSISILCWPSSLPPNTNNNSPSLLYS